VFGNSPSLSSLSLFLPFSHKTKKEKKKKKKNVWYSTLMSTAEKQWTMAFGGREGLAFKYIMFGILS